MNPEELTKLKMPTEGLWLPMDASVTAKSVDEPYWLIYWTCVVTFFLIIVPMFWFMWRYRRKHDGQKAESQEDHSQLLEILWSAIPTVFFIWIFVLGFRGFLDLQIEPQNSMQVYVRGFQWAWQMDYVEDADRNPLSDTCTVKGRETFVMPTGVPVKLILTSNDVLHSFFVPNFRIKTDAVPGRYTTLWFMVPEGKEGSYPIFCTEYCGTDHSRMLAQIKAVPKAEYHKWLETLATEGACGGGPSLDKGKKTYEAVCIACHSLDGSRRVGPSFKGLWGSKRKITGGTEVVADEAYVKESILQPNAKVADTYPAAMPPQALSEAEIQSLILFLKEQK